MSHTPFLDRRGLFAAAGAYALWGVFPLYWAYLKHVPALQIISHRVVWCAAFVLLWIALRGGWGPLRAALADWRVLRLLLGSSLLIGVNWGIYIWAVTHGHVIEASLGYFINPLVSVLLGVLLLGERLRRVQWTAVGLAAAGVLWLTLQHGTPPWIALSLAISFAFYGLLRRWASVDAVPGLAVENLVLFLPALGWLMVAELRGVAAFGHQPGWQDVLLVLGGALTAIPLIGFAYGAKRIPYTLVGLLQYISPSLQLLCGVLLLGETFSATQALGFGLIWAGLAVYAGDGWQRARRAQRAPLAETGS